MFGNQYEANTLYLGIKSLWNWITGKKSEDIVDSPETYLEVMPGVTLHDISAKPTSTKSYIDKQGRVQFDKTLTDLENQTLKTKLFSLYSEGPQGMSGGIEKYFLNQTGITQKAWDSFNEEEKEDVFKYGLFRIQTDDSLTAFKKKQEQALKDKNITISDQEKDYFSNLQKLQDKKEDISYDEMSNSFMSQLSQNALNVQKTDNSAVGKIGGIALDATMGAQIGNQFGGGIGAGIGAGIGTTIGTVSGILDYEGEEGYKESISKDTKSIENMLVDYYSNNPDTDRLYTQYTSNLKQLPDKDKNRLIKEFDTIGQSLFQKYNQYLVNNLSNAEKLDLLANYQANVDSTGDSSYAAIKLQRDLQDIAANKQSAMDIAINTGAQFTDSFVGQVIRANGMAMGLLNLSPESEQDEKESYWNNIIDNEVTRYGDGISTLHVWDPKEQEKYRKLGWVDNEILQTAAEEGDIWNLKSFPEIIGQFGFTAGSMFLAKLGSGAIHKGAEFAKKGIGATVKSATAMERALIMDKVVSKLEDIGHFVVAGGVGTIEGGLEGAQTYEDTYKIGMELKNQYVDGESEKVLQNLAETGRIDTLYQCYQLLGGNQTLEDFKDQQGNVNTDSLISQIVALNKTNTKDSPEQNKLGELMGTDVSKEQLQEIQQEAWKAGYIDFWINSIINGYLNHTLKAGQMSKYFRSAKDRWFGKYGNHFDITTQNGRFAANPKNITRWDLFKNRIKEAHAEGLEEYFQELAQAFGKGYVEDPIIDVINSKYGNKYEDVVVNDFITNMQNGLSKAYDMSTSDQAMKSYLYGALSTLVGGATINNERMTKREIKENGGNWMDYLTHWGFISLRTGFEPLVGNAVRNKMNKQNAEIADRFNSFFQDEDKQNIFFNVMAALGHRQGKDLMELLNSNDEARDSERKAVVSSLLALHQLDGTLYSEAVNKALKGQAGWNNVVQRDAETGEATEQDFLEVAIKQAEINGDEKELARLNAMQDAVDEFKQNADDVTKAKVGTTDNQIIAEVAKNAQQTIDAIKELKDVTKKVEREYGKNIDSDTKEALTHVLLQKSLIKKELDRLNAKHEEFLQRLGQTENGIYANQNGLNANETNVLLSEDGRAGLETTQKNLEKLKENETSLNEEIKKQEQRIKELQKTPDVTKALQDEIEQEQFQLGILQSVQQKNKLQIQQTQNAIKALESIRKKAIAMGLKSEKDIIVSAGDLANLDPMTLQYLLNDDNESKFSIKQQGAIAHIKRQAEAADNDFVEDVQTMANLQKKLDTINTHQLLFRQNPKFYKAYVDSVKEAKQEENIKKEFKDFFDINVSRQRIDEEGNVQDVSSAEFIQMLERITKDSKLPEQQRQARENVIFKILKQQAKKNKNTLYGEYEKYLKEVRSDLNYLERTAYFKNAPSQKKQTLRALVKYARSVGKRFNNFAKGGKVVHANDVLVYDDVVDASTNSLKDDFKEFLDREQISEEQYNDPNFIQTLAEIFSDKEQTTIRKELETVHSPRKKQGIDKGKTKNPPMPPTGPKSDLQNKLKARVRQMQSILNSMLGDSAFLNKIKNAKFFTKTNDISELDTQKQQFNQILNDLQNCSSIDEFNIKVMAAIYDEINNSEDDVQVFWQSLYDAIKNEKSEDSSIPSSPATPTGAGSESVNLYMNDGDITSNVTNEELRAALKAYLTDHEVVKALGLLQQYLRKNNKLDVKFIIDEKLANSANGNQIPIVAVVAVPSGENEVTNSIAESRFIDIDGVKYIPIGILPQTNQSTIVNNITKAANKQYAENKKTQIVNVNGEQLQVKLDSGSIYTKEMNKTSTSRSLFVQFLKDLGNKLKGKFGQAEGEKPNQQAFNRFLSYLYYVETKETDETTGEEVTRKQWVFRNRENTDPTKVYQLQQGDIPLLPVKLENLTHLGRNVREMFRENSNPTFKNFYYDGTNPFAIQLRNCFSGINYVLSQITDSDFENGTLNDEKTKKIQDMLKRYFWYEEKDHITNLDITQDDNGNVTVNILDNGIPLAEFDLAHKDASNNYVADFENAYSFAHNLLFETDAEGQTHFRETAKGDCLLKIQFSYNDIKDAVAHVKDSRVGEKGYDRMYDQFVRNINSIMTNYENFTPTASQVTLVFDNDQVQKLKVLGDPDAANPSGTDPNADLEGAGNNGSKGTLLDGPAKIAEAMISNSEQFTLTEDEDSYENEDQSFRGERVTSFIKDKDQANDDNTKVVSTSFGDYADVIIRKIFNGQTDSLLNMNDTELLEVFGIDNRQQFVQFINKITQLKSELETKGIFVKGVVKAVGTVRNKETGELHNLAGTVDLIAYDASGNWHLFDIKTKNLKDNNFSPETINSIVKENKEYWSNQLAMYSALLSKQYGIKFATCQNIIIPLRYSTSLYDKNNDYEKTYNEGETHSTLRDKKTGEPITGWLRGWEKSTFANGLTYVLSPETDMRKFATIFDNWEVVTGDESIPVDDVHEDQKDNPEVTFTFGKVQVEHEDNPLAALGFEDEDLEDEESTDNLSEWSLDNFQAVRRGEATFVVTVGDNTTVFDSETFNEKLENIAKKHKLSVEEVLQEWSQVSATDARNAIILQELECA